ncbi:unnamed protein product [Echinostoma caproni]|uniref:Core-2/I-Branching enzyme n=1 Tax=Echinostoma caproni TaxID=27848 RepID=A0A183AQ11_9TREM|nr:unnamed protein product [Echinostoma caproni]
MLVPVLEIIRQEQTMASKGCRPLRKIQRTTHYCGLVHQICELKSNTLLPLFSFFARNKLNGSNRGLKQVELNMTRTIFLLKVLVVGLLGLCFLGIWTISMSRYKHQDPILFRNQPVYLSLKNLKDKYYVHQEEKAFPLAFGIIAYTDIDRVIRLLRAIYRPHNFYCIHVDKKASSDYYKVMQEAVEQIGTNVFLIPDQERISVSWGHISTLEADLSCAKRLLEFSSFWRYWINLTGDQVPLIILSSMANTTNDTAISHPPLMTPTSIDYFVSNLVKWFKGAVHVALRREFVEYMIKNPLALKLLNALREWEYYRRFRVVADEQYFATLNNNPHVYRIPGSYTGDLLANERLELDVDFANMSLCGTNFWVRSICMLGLKDLDALRNSPRLFANKFIPFVEPEAYDQLEHWIEMKAEYERQFSRFHPTFNVSVYSNLDQDSSSFIFPRASC